MGSTETDGQITSSEMIGEDEVDFGTKSTETDGQMRSGEMIGEDEVDFGTKSTETDGQMRSGEMIGEDEVDFGKKEIAGMVKKAADCTIQVIKSAEKRLGPMSESRYEMNSSSPRFAFVIEPLDKYNEDIIRSLETLNFKNIKTLSLSDFNKKLEKGLEDYKFCNVSCVVVIVTTFPNQNFDLDGLLNKFREHKCLQGKPKLFFIQTFQDHNKHTDHALNLDSLPDDSMLFYSKVFVPVGVRRDDMEKCLLTKDISSIINEYGKSEELLHLTLKLNREISKTIIGPEKVLGFLSFPPKVLFSLKKKLYFFPKPSIPIKESN